ncbi:MAG: transposase [Clostridia bacterium]|nr:transposase [Clostridia bacterium]
MRLLFVHNCSPRKEWLALVSTDMSLSEGEILRLYDRRWEIETVFKVCRQYLHRTMY